MNKSLESHLIMWELLRHSNYSVFYVVFAILVLPHKVVPLIFKFSLFWVPLNSLLSVLIHISIVSPSFAESLREFNAVSCSMSDICLLKYNISPLPLPLAPRPLPPRPLPRVGGGNAFESSSESMATSAGSSSKSRSVGWSPRSKRWALALSMT